MEGEVGATLRIGNDFAEGQTNPALLHFSRLMQMEENL